MIKINLYKGKIQLSKILDGEGKGLVPVNQPGVRELSLESGRLSISPDFDAPLPPESTFFDDNQGEKGGR